MFKNKLYLLLAINFNNESLQKNKIESFKICFYIGLIIGGIFGIKKGIEKYKEREENIINNIDLKTPEEKIPL